MCKGIKDLFSEIYRNHLHHLHPFGVISECFRDKELAVFLVFAVVRALVVGGLGLETVVEQVECLGVGSLVGQETGSADVGA